jgi:TRAP transporter 4TM/12TM fusion protein
MAEILGISYIQVCIAAALPAVLYFCTALFTVDLEAAKLSLKGTQAAAGGKFTSVLKVGILYIIPILVLIVVLAFSYSPMKAALLGILALIVVSMVKKRTRIGIRKIFDALEQGAKIALQVAAVCACAGIIIGVVMVTGLGLNLSSFIIDISGGHLIVVLLLSMIASIILGMGLPTTASYIILAILAAPALMNLGVNPLAAHLFIFYFGCLSQITPPVAVAAYVGAGIAGGDAMKTAFQAVRLGITGFFIPYIFVYTPYVVLQIKGYSWLGTTLLIIQTVITSLFGAYLVAGSVQGWLLKKANIFERIVLFIGGISLLYSGVTSDVIGIGLFVVAFVIQKLKIHTGKLDAEASV